MTLQPITIKAIEIYPIALPYVEPLKTSFGVEADKVCVLIEVVTAKGVSGWGEASIELEPGYGSETIITGLHILKQFLVPRLLGQTITAPTEVPALIRGVRGHHHTKAGIEAAIWDAFARENDLRLVDLFAAMLPAHLETVPRAGATVGVSIGIQPTIDDTLAIIRKRVDQGYARIKLKIQPGWDVELAHAVRAAFPDISLMLDANSAYTLADIDHLKQLDRYHLLMIEQPLADDDIYEHGILQAQISTPVCLDESVKNASDLQVALQIGALKILNLKPARVGGFTESLKLYQICVETQTPLWIGGMLEVGVGRAAHVALAALPGVTLPCDISATDRYFAPDVTEPPFVLGAESTLAVPDGVGTGVTVQRDRLEAAVANWQALNPFE